MAEVGLLAADGHDEISICIDREYRNNCCRNFSSVYEDEFSIDSPIVIVVGIKLKGRGLTIISGFSGRSGRACLSVFTIGTIFTVSTVIKGYGLSAYESNCVAGLVREFLDALDITSFFPLFDGRGKPGNLRVDRSNVILDLGDLIFDGLDIALNGGVVILLGASDKGNA